MSRAFLEEHREIWRRKPVLQDVYSVWFEALVGQISPGGLVVEIGAGPGFMAEHVRSTRPDLRWIASDVVQAPWNDLAADGLRLPLRSGQVDCVVGLDLLHHLASPALFFEEAARVLRSGGTLRLVEPWVTWFSYPIYRWLHQEGCTIDLDPWRPFGVSHSAEKEPFQGDNAGPWRLVRTTPPQRWQDLGFAPPHVRLFNGFAYLFSLGFRRASLLPRPVATALMAVDRIAEPLSGQLGLRALLTWERR
jgi:SAM-dependent methyltransferase